MKHRGRQSSPSALTPYGSVSLPVTVQSINGLGGGYVNLSVTGGLPPGVTASSAQVYLSSYGSAVTTLTFYGSAGMPGGTYAVTVGGTFSGIQSTAAVSLATQVTTFQVNTPVGSAIVHNNGQQVQATQTVPLNNAPSYTTCSGPAGSGVTCSVVSTSPSAVTLNITAARGTRHGTYMLKLNNATTVHALLEDYVGPLSILPPKSKRTSISG